MKTNKLREEKNCLNCGHDVQERYCSHCGQENLPLHDSALHMMIHYVQDLFHYDGRFWHTLRSLVRYPGLVAKEYVDGKRRSNLEPIRYYVFASTVFFIAFFAGLKNLYKFAQAGDDVNKIKLIYYLEEEKKVRTPSGDTMEIQALLNRLRMKRDSVSADSAAVDSIRSKVDSIVARTGSEIAVESGVASEDTTRVTTDSSWFEKRLARKWDSVSKSHEGDEEGAFWALFDEVFHKLPQLLFLSLPFFAFYLWLLHMRKAGLSYADHFIFSLYHYSYLFTFLLFTFFLIWITSKLPENGFANVLVSLTMVSYFYPVIYLYLSMRRFYGKSRLRTFLNLSVLSFFSFLTILFLFGLIAFISLVL